MANYGYLSYSPYRDESQNGTEHYMPTFQHCSQSLHQPNNPLLQDEEAFTRLAYKLLSEQNDSRQQGERVLETIMTAEERFTFSEAYQKKIKSLATFANPGESTLDGLLRRLRNAFGDSLLISKIPIQQRCLHSSPFKTKVEISEGCKGDENHHINGYIAYPHPTAQRGQFERIPTDLSKQSSIQENTHKSAVHQNFHLEKNSVERDPEVRSKNRDLISIRDIPITRDSSLDRRFCEYTPPSRRSRRSKSSRRGSKSPSRKSPDYLKPTPILKKGPDNKHSAKETMTKLIVQIPKSPRGTENSEIFEMIPPKPKQHERKLKKLHALQAESKTRQMIMEEIDRATILLSQSTDPENRVRYRFILDSLKLELENLTAASSVSSLTMSADSTRQGKRIGKKPLAPLLRAPERRSSSPSRNKHFNETFSKKISRSKSPIPHDFNQRDELPVRPIFIEAREIPPTILCDYKLMEDGDSGSVRSNDEIMAVEPSKQSEKTIQAIRGEDILSKQNALGEMQAIISEENMLSKEYALGRMKEKSIVGSEWSQNPTSMKVLSPGSFPEDYQFEAEVEGRAFTATVPKGGVSIGEVFESTVTDWRATKYQETGIPHHHWRDGLFDCFRHGIDHPALWTSFIFAPSTLILSSLCALSPPSSSTSNLSFCSCAHTSDGSNASTSHWCSNTVNSIENESSDCIGAIIMFHRLERITHYYSGSNTKNSSQGICRSCIFAF